MEEDDTPPSVNDPPAAALQPALHAAKSGREGGKGGDGMWEPAPLLPRFRFLDEKHFFLTRERWIKQTGHAAAQWYKLI